MRSMNLNIDLQTISLDKFKAIIRSSRLTLQIYQDLIAAGWSESVESYDDAIYFTHFDYPGAIRWPLDSGPNWVSKWKDDS